MRFFYLGLPTYAEALRHQKVIGRDTQGGVMVKAALP
jgi:hypothetical protein